MEKNLQGVEVEQKPPIKNPHWSFTDEITYKDGRVETREGHNLVVDDISKLIAGLISGKIMKGVQYWAIGSGLPAWDAQWGVNDPVPTSGMTKLNNEIYRHLINASDIKYVDAQGNELPDGTPSTRIKITINVDYNQGNGDWREFGLVGGTATGTKDTGILIDAKYHKLIGKNSEMSIKRSIILEL